MKTPKTDLPVRTWLWDVPVALALLTRLPVPRLPDAVFAHSARAVWAYSLVGAVVGGCAAAVLWAATALGLPAPLAGGLALVCLVVLTGALHEDGLADTADGLWGGHDAARRLDIMKDSRIGAYGVIALILVLGLRWQGLGVLPGVAVVSAAMLARSMMPAVMWALPHARDTGLAHSVGRPDLPPVLAGLGLALVATAVLTGGAGLVAALAACLTALLIGRVAHAKIRGQTGDILGATQVISESVILLVFAALL